MKQKMRFIALRTTRVSDTSSIVTGYSPEHGRVSVMVRGVGKRGGITMKARLMPLTPVECQGERRPGREFFEISDVRAAAVMNAVYCHPVKNAIVPFLAEVLVVLLRDYPADEMLYSFLEYSVMRLGVSTHRAAVNFHLAFLVQLARFMGIEPDISTYCAGSMFDMSEGRFRMKHDVSLTEIGRTLDVDDSRVARSVMRFNYNNVGYVKLSRDVRNRILDAILQYYTLHSVSLMSLKTLSVLRELF